MERTEGGARGTAEADREDAATGVDLTGGRLHALGALLAATGGVGREAEKVRIAASGLPSVVSCELAAVGLRRDDDPEGWLLGVESREGEGARAEGALRGALDRLLDRVRDQGRSLVPDRPPPPFDGLGIRSLAIFPLRTVGSVLGVLLAGRDEPGGYRPEEEIALQVLSEQLALGVENLRLQRSLRRYSEELDRTVRERTAERDRSQRRLGVLLEVTNAVVSSLDRASLFAEITASLQEIVDFDRASLTLVQRDEDRLTVAALGGPNPGEDVQPVGSLKDRTESPLWTVIDEKRPRLCRDLSETAEWPDERDMFRTQGLRSYVSVPLVSNDRALGTLNVGSRRPRAYDEDDAAFLLQVARQFGLAVDNMLAYEEIQELRRQAELEAEYLREEVREARAFGEIVGESPEIRAVEARIEQVAPTDATVLIQGESGTGKELVAREIHARSDRSAGPMIKVNCASVPRELYESEFFGHVKGAFSGAVRDRAGRFAAADGGTLFLDEVGEIPPELQSKLLRVLQDGEYHRVGEERVREADVRVLAATNRNLLEEVRAGRFREDLYYRLAVFPIEVPPLRERKEDIPLLAEHFLDQAARELESPGVRLTEANVRDLRAYDWPGNVRELRNVIERAVITSTGRRLHFDLPGPEDRARREPRAGSPDPGGSGEDPGRTQVLTEAEMQRRIRENIEAALDRSDGKVYGPDGAAALLGIPPTTLASRLESLGIER